MTHQGKKTIGTAWLGGVAGLAHLGTESPWWSYAGLLGFVVAITVFRVVGRQRDREDPWRLR